MSDSGTFKGTAEGESGEEATLKGTFLADDGNWAKLRDRVVLVVALALIATFVWMAWSVRNINKGQVAIVQQQNDAQLCAQHDIVIAVRKIGDKLGLPVQDITVPDTAGLACP